MTSRERAPATSNLNGKRKRPEETGIIRGETGVGGEVERKDLVEKPSLTRETNPERKGEVLKDKDSNALLSVVCRALYDAAVKIGDVRITLEV